MFAVTKHMHLSKLEAERVEVEGTRWPLAATFLLETLKRVGGMRRMETWCSHTKNMYSTLVNPRDER